MIKWLRRRNVDIVRQEVKGKICMSHHSMRLRAGTRRIMCANPSNNTLASHLHRHSKRVKSFKPQREHNTHAACKHDPDYLQNALRKIQPWQEVPTYSNTLSFSKKFTDKIGIH
eukprot:1157079-Pelagomonas_calceolata.AAC.2